MQLARAAGADVQLTAEIGLWGYEATPADPFVLNHRNFPTATMLGDAAMVLGALVGGAGTTTIGCLGGAQIDRFGNMNSTRIAPRPVPRRIGWRQRRREHGDRERRRRDAHTAAHAGRCGYVTSPGRAVRALVTDLGVAREAGTRTAELVLTAVPAGEAPLADRIAAARAACGWDLAVGPTLPSSRSRPPRRSVRYDTGTPRLVPAGTLTPADVSEAATRRRSPAPRSTASTATAASNTMATSAAARKHVKP